MHIVLAAIATVLLIGWTILFVRAEQQWSVKISLCLYRQNEVLMSKKKRDILIARERLAHAGTLERLWRSFSVSEKSMLKELLQLKGKSDRLKTGKTRILQFLPLAGYTVLALCNTDSSTSPFFRKLVEQYSVLSGRQYAADNARFLLASSLSNSILGCGGALCLAAMLLMAGQGQTGLIVAGVGVALAFLVAYLPLDDLREKSEERADKIVREFPHAVSKLTLLVGAGMDMTQAWRETASSKQGTLYQEMQTVIDEINNGISPNQAYNGFIHRCNDKFASKLGTSIMQNLSKGNEEICALLRELTAESWSERRHYAKRKGELAQSKLLLPIMMMFGGIILLVMTPVVANFMGMGF